MKKIPIEIRHALLFAIIVIPLVVLLVVAPWNRKKIGTTKNPDGERVSLATDNGFDSDTDGDGVPDWQESLWGTDPTVVDTDGDGISDKKEIEELRAAATDNGANLNNTTATTVTNGVAQTIIATLGALQNQDYISTTQKAKLAYEIQNVVLAPPTFPSKEEISMVKNSPDSFDSYIKKLNKILGKYPKEADQVFKYIEDAVNGDNSAVVTLEKISTDIQSIAKDLLGMQVPNRFVEPHFELVLSNYEFAHGIENISKIQDDSLRALGGVRYVLSGEDRILQAVETLENYFVASGII
ncbi:MAG: hypothetical protein OEX08_00355 [Candidatus Nomurabacteria bacterium]|nr:hypothetical protein [Candidatus Nomurabacteria bacterium]